MHSVHYTPKDNNNNYNIIKERKKIFSTFEEEKNYNNIQIVNIQPRINLLKP